jgi:hypothetical protein
MKILVVILFCITLNPLTTFGQWTWTTSGSNMFNSNPGDIGIGTNTPGTRLHIRKNKTVSELSSNPMNDLVSITLNAPDGFVPANTIQRLTFKFQDWGTNEASYGAIGVVKEADLGGVYGGGKLNFYTYGPARGANEPSPGLINTFSIDRFGNTSVMATMHYMNIPASNTILKLRFHTPHMHVPYGTENRISFATKGYNNNEEEISVISSRVGDAEPGIGSYGGGEILFYTKDSSPGGGLPGAGLLERMRVDNKGRVRINGNVGIGVAIPQAKLDLAGSANISDGLDVQGAVNMSGGRLSQFGDIPNNNSAAFSNSSATGYGFYSQGGGAGRYAFHFLNQAGATVLYGDGAGNVGIGTTTPRSFKLAVNGKIWTQEVNVAMDNPGPDYVFEKDYNLVPLSELETYITQNKHLPEVPSAREMAADGLNLKEMNLLLLKKVEELTLHLIEINKSKHELSEQVNTLQIEMKELKTLIDKK